jgi:hypothetical protein
LGALDAALKRPLFHGTAWVCDDCLKTVAFLRDLVPFSLACGAAEVVPFPVVAQPNPWRDGGVESHVSQRTRDVGHPASSERTASTGAEARFLLGALDAALKRPLFHGGARVRDDCFNGVSVVCCPDSVRLIRACGRAEVVLLVTSGENVHGG